MDAEIDEPELSDLCRVGTIAQIKQVLNLPGDSIRVLVEGVRRGVLGTVPGGGTLPDGYRAPGARGSRARHP